MSQNSYSVLPFYGSLEQQLCRRSYAYGEVYPLYGEVGHIIPFQFILPNGLGSLDVSAVSVVDFNTGVETDVTLYIGILKKPFTGYDVFVCYGGLLNGISHEGRWYFKVLMSDNTVLYSEVFTAVNDLSPYLKIEWWDEQDLVMKDGRIVYDYASPLLFHNVVYLDSQLGMPDYEFEDEGEKRDGLFFPEKMISMKKYKFSFLAPEYLLDVMRFIRMSDHIQITDCYGETYEADTFLITSKWQTPGMLAGTDCEFQTSIVAKKIGNDFT